MLNLVLAVLGKNIRFQICSSEVSKAKLLLEATFFIIIFIIPEVDIQVQNGQGVLGSLVPSILNIGLACRGSMAILDLYIYFR